MEKRLALGVRKLYALPFVSRAEKRSRISEALGTFVFVSLSAFPRRAAASVVRNNETE